MPVRSSTSRVLEWPRRDEVIAALRESAADLRAARPEIIRIGFFGSLADARRYGVGSDADVVIIVTHTARPVFERLRDYDLRGIPVPVDVLVYTEAEFARIMNQGGLFAREMANVVWL